MAAVNPLDYAIQLERDGQVFYSEAAAGTRSPLGRKMFESLAADERRHEQLLGQVAAQMDVALPDDTPRQRIVTLFGELGDQMRADLGAEPEDTDVVRKAIDMERRSVELYAERAGQAGSDADRGLYERLTLEEREHLEILENTLSYLSDTGQWFLWGEQGLLDGG